VISRAVLDGKLDDPERLRAQLVEFILVFY
jgi:hypothetical protein